MANKLNREELVTLVTRIIAADVAEDEINAMIAILELNVPHPKVSDLIFYPQGDMTAEEIVDTALTYQPLKLD